MPSLQKRIPMYITLPVAVAAVVAVPVISYAVGKDRYAIVAEPVTGDRAAGINSGFKIVKADPPVPGNPDKVHGGITSDLLGGACIVFRASDLDGFGQMAAKTCKADGDCTTAGLGGYCEHKAKKCWARPVADPDPLCRRSIDPGAPTHWPVGTVVPISANPIPVPAGLHPDAQARTIACLRGPNLGCGQDGSISEWGEATAIP